MNSDTLSVNDRGIFYSNLLDNWEKSDALMNQLSIMKGFWP